MILSISFGDVERGQESGPVSISGFTLSSESQLDVDYPLHSTGNQ